MTPFKIPKIKTPEIPKVEGLDPKVLEKIKEILETVVDLITGETRAGEIVEDEVKVTIHEKVMEQLEPSLDNDIAKKLADKAVDKAIDKSWNKIKQRLVLKFSKEE